MSLYELGSKTGEKKLFTHATKQLRFVIRHGKHRMMKNRAAMTLVFSLFKSGHKKKAKKVLEKLLIHVPRLRHEPRIVTIMEKLRMR